MPATYSNALSPQAKQILNTHYGETGLKYGGIANWPTMIKIFWLYFVKKISPVQALFQTNHPLQLHYGIWDKSSVKNFSQSVRRATQVAYQAFKISPKKSTHIFHAGCGWGGTELQLAQEHPNLKTTGVSISADQISMAKQFAKLYKLEKQSLFSKQNFLKLPPKWKEKFDGCLAIESLCHVPEKQFPTLFSSLINTLKPKARLVVQDCFLTKKNPSTKERLMLKQLRKGWDMPGPHAIKNFCDQAKSAGFKLARNTNITPYVMRSAKAIYWRGVVFTPIVKLLQNNQNKLVKELGLGHPQLLDFVIAVKVQKHLFEKNIIDYRQLVFEKA